MNHEHTDGRRMVYRSENTKKDVWLDQIEYSGPGVEKDLSEQPE